LTIANADMDFNQPDNIYIQFSLYYKQNPDDLFIPYVVSNGAIHGANFEIFNANPALAGVSQFTGRFYLYYELYNF